MFFLSVFSNRTAPKRAIRGVEMAGDSESDNISTSTSGSDAVTSLSSDAVSVVKKRDFSI